MRKRIAAFLALTCAMGAVSAKTLSMDAYLAAVQQNNKDLALAKVAVSQADATLRKALSTVIPTLGVSLGYQRSFSSIKLGDDYLDDNPQIAAYYPLVKDDLDDGKHNQLTVGIGAQWNIYDPSNAGNIRLAKEGKAVQSVAEAYTLDSLRHGARVLYSQVQLLQSVLSVKQEMAETSRAVYEMQKRKYDAGTLAELDMRLSEVDMKNDELGVMQAKKNLSSGLTAFRVLAGYDPDDDIEPVADDGSDVEAPSEAYAIDDALANRLDWQIALLSQQVAQTKVENSYLLYNPSVSMSASYLFGTIGGLPDSNNPFSLGDVNANLFTIGFTVTLPVSTGGYRLANTQDAKLEVEKANLNLLKKQDAIKQELKDVQLEGELAQSQLEAARVIVTTSQRAVDLARTSVENGLATQTTLTQAETQLAQAKVNLASARYACKVALYDGEFAMGRH